MSFVTYSVMTLLGSALWCTILAWFGAKVLGERPELLADPAGMVRALSSQLHWFVAAVLILLALYILAMRLTARRATGA
jgi:membrane protein DedA with SNARE-associated domain